MPDPPVRRSATSAYHYLCCNCGSITPVSEWAMYHYTEGGKRRKPKRDETDPVCECPVCLYEHTDDDSGPGVYDGTREQMEAQRTELLRPKGRHDYDGWGEDWAEVMAEVQARNGWTGREDCVEEVRRGL